jgi:hypothetical protein
VTFIGLTQWRPWNCLRDKTFVNRSRYKRNSYRFMSQCSGIPRLTEILTRDFKEVNWHKNILETHNEFVFAGVKVRRGEGGGWILLGDNTGGGAITLPPIRFERVGIWILAGLPCVYVHGWAYEHSIQTCAGFPGTQILRKSLSVYCQMIELLQVRVTVHH